MKKALFVAFLLSVTSTSLFSSTGISNVVTNWETEKQDTKQTIKEKKKEIEESIDDYNEVLVTEKKLMVEKINRLMSILMLSRRTNIEMKEILHEKKMANKLKK